MKKTFRLLLPALVFVCAAILVLSFLVGASRSALLAAVGAAPASLASHMESLPLAAPVVAANAAQGNPLNALPLQFVANAGQARPEARYTVNGAGHALYFLENEVLFASQANRFAGKRPGMRDRQLQRLELQMSTLRLGFVGANRSPEIDGGAQLSGVANYFLGNDPAQWRVNVPTFQGVVYRDLYPGVDLRFGGIQGELKSEFILQPGVDPGVIAMRYEGAKSLRLSANGDLLITTPSGVLVEEAPVIYQEAGGERQLLSGGYLLDSGQVGFWVAGVNPDLPLVIDPAYIYSSYLGGATEEDVAYEIRVDAQGNIFVTGYTYATDFPLWNALYTSPQYIFVTKIIQANGVYTYAYSTYLGGSSQDMAMDLAVDSQGNAIIAGVAQSTDFPITNNAPQKTITPGDSRDAFVTKIISASGIYTLGLSTFLGGNGIDQAWGVDVAPDGAIWVAGVTDYSSEANYFPTTPNALIHSPVTSGYAFVTKYIQAGGVYTYAFSTLLGGDPYDDQAYDIAVDSAGNAYVTGDAWTENFPVYKAIDSSMPIYGKGFVTKYVYASGVYTYGYSTFLGANDGNNHLEAIAVDDGGNAYVTGFSTGSYPRVKAVDNIRSSFYEPVVSKISPSGAGYVLAFSSFLGGSGDSEYGNAIATDGHGNIYVTGYTNSTDFPTWRALQPNFGGMTDIFVTKIIQAGEVYTYGYSTYLGGNNYEGGWGIDTDASGKVYVSGHSKSTTYPTLRAIQPVGGGAYLDAVVTVLGETDLAISKRVTPSGIIDAGDDLTYTLVFTNNSDLTATGVVITDLLPITLTGATYQASGVVVTPTGSAPYVWQVSNMPGRASGQIRITAQVSPTVQGMFQLSNLARIASTSAGFKDENQFNDSASVNSQVSGACPILGLAAANDSPTLWGESTAFTATVTAGCQMSYLWDFGDGTSGSGQTTGHVYAKPGVYTAKVTGANPYDTQFATTQVVVTCDCCARLGEAYYHSVQQAVDASASGSDVVKIAGTCSGVNNQAGLAQVVYLDKPLTLQGGYTITNWTLPDPQAYSTTLDAQGDGRVLYLDVGAEATLLGLRLTGGDAEGLGGGAPGMDTAGGVYAISATLTMQNCELFGNMADNSGGMDLAWTPATLTENWIHNNTANADGGGLTFYYSPVTLTHNLISENQAGLVYGGDGAGVSGFGDGEVIQLEHNTILSNTALYNIALDEGGLGGGVSFENVIVGLSGNTLEENDAGEDGGGIYLYHTDATLDGNLVASNTADQKGGGVFLEECYGQLANNAIVDNQASEGGSGMAVSGGQYQALHTTLSGNTGSSGLALYPPEHPRQDYITMTNTILAGHSVGVSVTASMPLSLEWVLWDPSTPVTLTAEGGATVNVQSQLTGDPAFDADGYHLTLRSAAIDTAATMGVAVDIDSQPRPMNGAPDLGADEHPHTLLLTGAGTGFTPDGLFDCSWSVTEPITLTYAFQPFPTKSTGSYQFAGMAFQLGAFAANGDPLLAPIQPLTITLHYDESALPAGIDEAFLGVYRYDPLLPGWVALIVLDRDLANDTLTMLLDHFSEFALLGETPGKVYLPLVRR